MQASGNTTMCSCKKKKNKSNELCSCHKTFKQILCTLSGKSFSSASVKGRSQFYTETAQINAPKALTEGNVRKKEFVTVS